MIISPEFTSKIMNMSVDEKYLDAISHAYRDFSRQIMIEMTTFSYEPSKLSFACLDLTTKEYLIQKHMELRLETYVRQFLVSGFFREVFESRGYEIDTPSYYIPDNQVTAGEEFHSTIDFERNAGFEFVIDDDLNRYGCRFTDIQPWEAKKWLASGIVTKIVVIDWFNTDYLSESEKKQRANGVNAVTVTGINEFTSQWLGKDESEVYKLFVNEVMQRYKETLGISSLPKLTAPVLFGHRLDEEEKIKVFIQNIRTHSPSRQRAGETVIPDVHYGYRIIDPNSFKTEKEINCAQNIESRSEQFLSVSNVLDVYSTRKLYKVLVGRNDFAKSFLTSEYLYSQYNENDLFDYTSIVSGYLKSIEQLLLEIIMRFADKPINENNASKMYRIKSNGKKNENGEYPASSKKEGKAYTINFSLKELEYADTTIGALIYFVRNYKQRILTVKREFQDIILDCLECYRIECRNNSFHKHNNYDWKRVNMIRHNTLILYIMLLGGIEIGTDEDDVKKRFGVVTDDRLERIYYSLKKQQGYSFKIKIDGDYYLATREPESSFPEYDKNGLLQEEFAIYVNCKKEKSVDEGNRKIRIDRKNIPEEIWRGTFLKPELIDFEM